MEKKDPRSEAYLFLLREGYFTYAMNETAGKFAAALLQGVTPFTKDQVQGDSLDIPFVKWIRIHDFKHEVSFAKKDEAGNLYALLENQSPSQEHVKFTCLPGKQTPQLAFGCMAQEKFPLAIFCFRRQTGVGYEVRVPHLVIGMKDCLIRDWNLGGKGIEEATLWSNTTAWVAASQLADTNLPNPAAATSMGAFNFVGAMGSTNSAFTKFVAGFAVMITALADAAVGAYDVATHYGDK
jgi:type VI protein secretion system component Hcp